MAEDASAVLATRVMHVYYAPFNATNTFPLDTVNLDVDWGAPWVKVGFTDGGLTANINMTRADITVDQLLDPVLHPVTGRSITFTTDLAESVVNALNLAVPMGSIATVAPGVGTKGHDSLVISGVPTDIYNSWGFEAAQQNGEPLRGIIWKGLGTGSPAPSFGQADTKAVVALEVSALPDSSTTPARIAEFRSVIPATS